jgi:RNA polymerase-binding transcription factor DksA
MGRQFISDTFRAISDRIPFGRPDGPTEWLAPDPRDADPLIDAPFPGPLGSSAAAAGPLAAGAASESLPEGPIEVESIADESGITAPVAPAKKASVRRPSGRQATASSAADSAPAAAKPPEPVLQAEGGGAEGEPVKKAAAKQTPAKRAPARKRAPAKKAAAKKAAATTPSAEPREPTPAAPAGPSVPEEQSTAPATEGLLPVRPGEEPWTEEEVAEVAEDLRGERERLLEEIAYADEQLAEMLRDAGDNAVDDQADAGTRTFEREQEISLAAGTAEKLAQVDRARRRLADGSYGLCENCGQPIGKLRLQAFPRATLCLSCKESQERR